MYKIQVFGKKNAKCLFLTISNFTRKFDAKSKETVVFLINFRQVIKNQRQIFKYSSFSL